MKRLSIFASLIIVALGACVSQSQQTPATLTQMDDANVAALKSALADAMGRANFKLGANGDVPATQVTVLPPPRGEYEMNSPALPTHFDIVTNGTECWLIQQDTGEAFPAPGVRCKTLPTEQQ